MPEYPALYVIDIEISSSLLLNTLAELLGCSAICSPSPIFDYRLGSHVRLHVIAARLYFWNDLCEFLVTYGCVSAVMCYLFSTLLPI